MDADIVFRGGTVVDGTGAAPFVGDVAVRGGVIIGVGPQLPARGAREVDAAGKHIMPGWVDCHTHLDAQVMWDPVLSPSAPAGVTTVVTGNCGVGIAPTRNTKQDREFMVDLMSTIEDIPEQTLWEGIQWQVGGRTWETFAEYLAALSELSFVCDIAALVPHSCVRAYVLGPQRASLSDRHGGPVANPLTQAEKLAVARCVQDGIRAGAVGFATNRFIGHRDSKGVLSPGSLADADEVVMVARAIAEAGGGTLELATDFALYDDVPWHKMDAARKRAHHDREWRWMEFVSKEYGVPVNCAGVNPTLRKLDEVAASGGRVYNQTLPRPQAFLMNFQSRGHPFAFTPLFKEIKELPRAEMVARLGDRGVRARILAQLEALMAEPSKLGRMTRFQWGQAKGWNAFYPITEGWTYEPSPQQSVGAVARATGESALGVAYDHMLTRGGSGTLWRGFANVDRFYDVTRERLQHPRVVPGVSDAGAHLAIFQDATTPTSMVSFWARDRRRGGGALPLELCVRKQARDTAYLYGLTDRGTLEVGKKADINLVDLRRMRIHDPELVHDLPAGAPRWDQRVSGYEMTLCSGVVTFEGGRHTGALPGRVARNPNMGTVRTGLAEVPAEFTGYRAAAAGTRDASTAESMLKASMEADGGISNMSRVTNALEEEGKKRARL